MNDNASRRGSGQRFLPRPTPTPGQSHRNFFPTTSNTEVIEAEVETYLFPADYKSSVNSSSWRRGSRVFFSFISDKQNFATRVKYLILLGLQEKCSMDKWIIQTIKIVILFII